MIAVELRNLIAKSLKNLGLDAGDIHLEHPEDMSHGDYSANVAMAQAKALGINPKELAEKIRKEIENKLPSFLSKIEIAGPGFINFYLSDEFLKDSIGEIRKEKKDFGKNQSLKGEKAIVEYTDPNPFKEFHIGHLMSNAIGESVSRLVELSGAKTARACYQGDVGLHVAKAVAGIMKGWGDTKNVSNLGRAYAAAAQVYDKDEEIKKEINKINKKIYDRTDKAINKVYDAGRKLSLDHFETIYKKLGTKFDYKFFESETGQFGNKIVMEFLKKGIFEESDGAVIFRGEKYDPKLHTRVFINKEGLPTYEAKELGLAKIKYDKYKYDASIVITGNEVNEYFKVLLKAMELVYPELARKTKHISHGMLRLPTGKMSSRTGDVITGESLINQVEEMVKEKIKDRNLSEKESADIASQVAVGAIKYSILKQAPGRDTIFDMEKSISFEGDSGPYLQYAYTRAKSILKKAKEEKIPTFSRSSGRVASVFSQAKQTKLAQPDTRKYLESFLYRFPEVVEKSMKEYAPHHVLTYLTNLAQTFNTFYAHEQIVNPDDPNSSYKVALTEAFSVVLANGLYILGIPAPEKM
jgi:arginyl-tRNA synthetase